MNEKQKRRSASFKRILPNIFFSNKSKSKPKTESIDKSIDESFNKRLSCDNKYTTLNSSDIYESPGDVNRIYENLKNFQGEQYSDNLTFVGEISNASSSSTLVSDKYSNDNAGNQQHKGENNMSSVTRPVAAPQVPRMEQKEITDAGPVFFHNSKKKLTDKRSPIAYAVSDEDCDKMPKSVGAQITCSSTQFTITPKKESAVLLNKQMRAHSLSPINGRTKGEKILQEYVNAPEKPYIYSAPTTSLSGAKKTPNMPEVHKSVSPYEHVRKRINQAEELSTHNTINSKNYSKERIYSCVNEMPVNKIPNNTETNLSDRSKECQITKESTRKNVEAFYWQKLKQMKLKEEQYLLNRVPTAKRYGSQEGLNLRSSPSKNLPRGDNTKFFVTQTQKNYSNHFIRGGHGRNTVGSTNISDYQHFSNNDVVLRHPEKNKYLFVKNADKPDNNKKLSRDRNDYFKVNDQNTRRANSLQDHTDILRKVGLQSHINILEVPTPPPRTTSWTSAASTAKYLLNARRSQDMTKRSITSGSESGSECAEIRNIIRNQEEDARIDDYQSALSDVESGRAQTRGRLARRDDPRRHTLAGNHHFMHAYHPQQLRALDLERRRDTYRNYNPEYAIIEKNKEDISAMQKQAMARGYQPQPNAMFDDDPGIMSEVETSSTGFRRGGKQRSSLPVVRTPSKTLERPLGLVFLQFRNETKRALLPNEITSIDTVKALFVRSFPQQLNMHYMDSPLVKIYIHDSNKDMFYELEDMRAHLRDIGDRSVLRLFESVEMGGGGFPGALNVGTVAMPPGAAGGSGPASWDQDQNYFSEPEMDSEYHHQHIHKSKQKMPQAYYMGPTPPSTLPRRGSLLRTYSPAVPPVSADRVKSLPPGSVMSQSSDTYAPSDRLNLRCDEAFCPYVPSANRTTAAPIDEETGDGTIDDFAMYAGAPSQAAIPPRAGVRTNYAGRCAPAMDTERERWIGVEQQLANLTGLVTALVNEEGIATGGHGGPSVHGIPGVHGKPSLYGPIGCGAACSVGPPLAPRLNLDFPYRGQEAEVGDEYATTMKRAPKLGKDRYQKSVSFEKSVSFSDDPPDMNSPKQHSPIHTDSKPPKPAIKSSTLPRTSSQERDRLKPAPPPKPIGLVAPPPPGVAPPSQPILVNVTADFNSAINEASRSVLDLQLQLRNLRRTVLAHTTTMRKMITDTTADLYKLSEANSKTPDGVYYLEDTYRQQMLSMESDLYDLEAMVERLRGQAANNRETRVNMADVEHIAMILSRSSRTVADWKLNLPGLCDKLKRKISAEMEKLVRKEKLLDEEPERLEIALRRCKKLTGTLVTLKRLACVQEQRLPCSETGRVSPGSGAGCYTIEDVADCDAPNAHVNPKVSDGGSHGVDARVHTAPGACAPPAREQQQRPENALDALLDELQTFAKPPRVPLDGSLRRLASYPSGSDTDASPPVRPRHQPPPVKPPVPERHPELLALASRRAPPPPPPRTSSRSPLASPPSPASPDPARQLLLEQRHQELLKKQRALQEQYARLQMIQRSSNSLPLSSAPDLKKTGSESNLLNKMNLNLSVSGSLTHLAAACAAHPATADPGSQQPPPPPADLNHKPPAETTSTKVYETDIL